MKPTYRFFLFALIIFLLFGTVPVVHAQTAGDSFSTAEEIYCDDPPLSYGGEIRGVDDPDEDPAQEDYWKVHLVTGQDLTIDIDALANGSTLDSILQVFDENENLIGMNDQSSEYPLNEDPYLEITADVDGYYFLVISASTPGQGADTGTYSFLLTCSDTSLPPAPVDPVKIGDLLGSTDSKTGSLVSINPADGASNVRFSSVTGPIADVEYQYSTHSLFVAINDSPSSIITIDPDTGVEGQVFNVDLGAIIALEDAAGILYGVHVVLDEFSGDPLYSLVNVDHSTGELVFLASIDQQPFSALAYHSAEKILYGTVSGTSGADLVKIDLTSFQIETVGPTGLGQIVALDFSHENVLYGVDLSGFLFFIPDLTTGQAEKIAPIDVSPAVTTLASTAAAPTGVSGLAFVVGEPPDVEPVKIICSSTLAAQMDADFESAAHKISRFKLKNRLRSGAVGLFKFQAAAGENIIIRLAPEVEESVATNEESAVSELETLWPRWNKGKGRLFLGLRDAIPGVKIRERAKGTLPLELAVENLAEGQYYIMVIQPLFRFNKVDYCLTLESNYQDSQAWESLEVAWPNDDSQDDTTSTSSEEQTDVQKSTETLDSSGSEGNGTVQVTLSTTAIAPTSSPPEEITVEEPVEVPPEEPAAGGGDTEVVQTVAGDTAVEDPVEVLPEEPVADGGDPEVMQTDGGGDTTVVEPVVVTVDEPVVETPVEVDPAANDDGEAESGDDSSNEVVGDEPMEDPLPMKG